MICEEIAAWAYLHDNLIIFMSMDYGVVIFFDFLRLAYKVFLPMVVIWLIFILNNYQPMVFFVFDQGKKN